MTRRTRTDRSEARRAVTADPQDLTQMRVYIVDRKHPHFPESGTLTGQIISVLGTPMAEITLEHCQHGTDGCFVQQGQIAVERRRRRP